MVSNSIPFSIQNFIPRFFVEVIKHDYCCFFFFLFLNLVLIFPLIVEINYSIAVPNVTHELIIRKEKSNKRIAVFFRFSFFSFNFNINFTHNLLNIPLQHMHAKLLSLPTLNDCTIFYDYGNIITMTTYMHSLSLFLSVSVSLLQSA